MTNDGFGLAVGVMVLLGLSLLYALVVSVRGAQATSSFLPSPSLAGILLPVLAVIGAAVAGYLIFVETSNVPAVCGPVGSCNEVQSSPFARLFGILPVGMLGLAGYAGIVLCWALARWGSGRAADLAPLGLFAMALFGVLFSVYLTMLELFVIRAVCIWCLTSASLMALILILAVGPAMSADAGDGEIEES